MQNEEELIIQSVRRDYFANSKKKWPILAKKKKKNQRYLDEHGS